MSELAPVKRQSLIQNNFLEIPSAFNTRRLSQNQFSTKSINSNRMVSRRSDIQDLTTVGTDMDPRGIHKLSIVDKFSPRKIEEDSSKMMKKVASQNTELIQNKPGNDNKSANSIRYKSTVNVQRLLMDTQESAKNSDKKAKYRQSTIKEENEINVNILKIAEFGGSSENVLKIDESEEIPIPNASQQLKQAKLNILPLIKDRIQLLKEKSELPKLFQPKLHPNPLSFYQYNHQIKALKIKKAKQDCCWAFCL